MPITPITIKDAANLTGRTAYEIWQITERGDLPFAMLNGIRLVSYDDVVALLVPTAGQAAS